MPHQIFIVCIALFIWIIHSLVILGVLLFVLRYVQTAHSKYVHYFSNYIWVAACFCVLTLAHTMLIIAGLWPAILNKAAVLDGIRFIDAQLYTVLTVQSECIAGLNVRRRILFFGVP